MLASNLMADALELDLARSKPVAGGGSDAAKRRGADRDVTGAGTASRGVASPPLGSASRDGVTLCRDGELASADVVVVAAAAVVAVVLDGERVIGLGGAADPAAATLLTVWRAARFAVLSVAMHSLHTTPSTPAMLADPRFLPTLPQRAHLDTCSKQARQNHIDEPSSALTRPAILLVAQ
jgi:hypothetical protein